VHDSHNIEFACRVWGLRATDLNQGVVYGQQTSQTALDDRLATRFDYDAIFGTVLNRFVVQSVLGEALTIYGEGGQTRGIIDIRDTVECVRLTSEQPPEAGEFRVFNQMTESMTITDLAKVVATSYPGEVSIENIDNPRVEAETHYYNVVHTGLVELGLTPHCLSETLISSMFAVAERYKHRVDPEALLPLVNWRRTANRVRP
jgi:UDP-sulfoquinovose synthase